MQTLRSYFVFAFLFALKALARLAYRFELTWLAGERSGESDDDPWRGIRVAAVLHHTSLADRRAEAERDGITVTRAVVRDLEARRDRHCPGPATTGRSVPA